MTTATVDKRGLTAAGAATLSNALETLDGAGVFAGVLTITDPETNLEHTFSVYYDADGSYLHTARMTA
jgi:hypothetical protein